MPTGRGPISASEYWGRAYRGTPTPTTIGDTIETIPLTTFLATCSWTYRNVMVEEIGPCASSAKVIALYKRRGLAGIIRAVNIFRTVFKVADVHCVWVDGLPLLSPYIRYDADDNIVTDAATRITLGGNEYYSRGSASAIAHNLSNRAEVGGICFQHDTGQYALTIDSYRWERDGHYHSYEEPYDDDDDDDSHDGVCGYHSQRRNPPRETYDLAVELEVHTTSGTIEDIVETVNRHGHIVEDDSSLSSGGVEIVQRTPCQLEDVIDNIGWHDIVSTLPSQVGRNGYGMHVSVNAPDWSIEHETVFVAFWTANEDLVISLAGRRYNEDYAYKGIDVTCDDDLHRKRSEAGSRYAACSLRGNGRIEVRLFRTTRVWTKFAGRVQLVDAVARWAANCKEATHAYVTNISGKGGLLEYMTDHSSKYEHAIALVKRWMGEEV